MDPDLVEEIGDIVIAGGLVGKRYFTREIAFASRIKPGGDIVTDADPAIEEAVNPKLRAILPTGSVIVAEEESNTLDPEALDRQKRAAFESPLCLPFDPIDATKNFNTGVPYWAVSLGGLEKRTDGHVPTTGWIYNPMADILFYTDGSHVYRVRDASTHLGKTRRQDAREQLSTPTFTTAERGDLPFLFNSGNVGSYRLTGIPKFETPDCTALHLTRVVDGTAVGTFHSTKAHIWDIAAGHAMCRVLGLEMYGLDTGKPRIAWRPHHFLSGRKEIDWCLTKEYAASHKIVKDFIREGIK